MPPRSSLPFFSSSSDARTATLQGLLIATIVICALYFGSEILLPLALAILLSFVLTPPLLLLRRLKVPRVLAVGLLVGFAFLIIAGLGWLISREVTQLAADLPGYQATLSKKIQSLRDSTTELSRPDQGRPCAQQSAKRTVRANQRRAASTRAASRQ